MHKCSEQHIHLVSHLYCSKSHPLRPWALYCGKNDDQKFRKFSTAVRIRCFVYSKQRTAATRVELGTPTSPHQSAPRHSLCHNWHVFSGYGRSAFNSSSSACCVEGLGWIAHNTHCYNSSGGSSSSSSSSSSNPTFRLDTLISKSQHTSPLLLIIEPRHYHRCSSCKGVKLHIFPVLRFRVAGGRGCGRYR